MRFLASVIALLCLCSGFFGCKPEIVSDTYFCGPERLCPEGLRCDESSANCLSKELVEDFACSATSADTEPDDAMDEARELGELACGRQLAVVDLDNYQSWGCLDAAADVDHYSFEVPTCESNLPHIEIRVQYHVAFAPVYAELLDENGTTVVAATLCTAEGNQSGTEMLCLELENPSEARYTLRVGMRDEANCEGDCSFNRYVINLSYPLS